MNGEATIEGTLLMLDDATPHVAVPVQAIRDGKVIATTLSDESGRYQLINLKPGQYQLRCQVLGGYVYYRVTDRALRSTPYDSQVTEPVIAEDVADVLQVEGGKALKGIDLRFAPLKKGTWRNYTSLDGLANSFVYAMYADPDGVMWFGTHGGGVSRYDGGEFVDFTTKDGLAGNEVFDIHPGSDGALWFGTLGSGVSRYDGKEFTTFTTKDGLASNTVATIYCDQDGTMWFGTGMWGLEAGGVSCYDGNTFVNFTQKDGLAGNWVSTIYRDPDGVMWFGIDRYPDGGGVSRYDGKTFVNLTEYGLANNAVWAIHRDPDGVMWFGTRGGGVFRYDGKTSVNFTTKEYGLNNFPIWDRHGKRSVVPLR